MALGYTTLYHKLGRTDKLFPIDKSINRAYARILAGVVFPGEQPGFMVALGQDYLRHENKFYWLCECSGVDTGEFLRQCIQLKSIYKIEQFYAPPDPAIYHFLTHFNQSQRAKDEREFQFNEVPYYDNGKIKLHLDIMSEQLKTRSKSLSLDKESILPDLLSNMPDSFDLLDKDHPELAALAYVTTMLVAFPYTFDEFERVQKAYVPMAERR